ncbi:hypothetical protein PMSD_07860 [Paenibacillus macquariensis subsp. defensor]|nr:hypothetical protein PMSD_07860 [Paenibacillus macquariensis subsp. defensor]
MNSKYLFIVFLCTAFLLQGYSSNGTSMPQLSQVRLIQPVDSSEASSVLVSSVSVKTKDKKFDHIIVVVEENHSYKQIVGNKKAPFMQSLMERGTLFTNAHGITHPSQPNYLAMFSGSTQGIKDDSCKGPFTAENLASELLRAKYSFIAIQRISRVLDLPNVILKAMRANITHGRNFQMYLQG